MRSPIALTFVLVAALCASGCRAPTPRHAAFVAGANVETRAAADVVRAAGRGVAVDVARMLAEVKPAVLAALPGTRDKQLEVWVQDELSLFRGEMAGHDVDGFHVVDTGRIHLRRASPERMRATLAHEVVHALVEAPWRCLPPVVEEGVADWVATQVCRETAARIRAGRLSDAGGALGGLSMRLHVDMPSIYGRTALPSRILLSTDAQLELDSIFAAHVHGLDALKASTDVRPGLYGCGFLLVDRIVEERGIEHLYDLCRRAHAAGQPLVGREDLLAAARLAMSARSWTLAAARALSVADVHELGRRHARNLVALLDKLRMSGGDDGGGADLLATYRPQWGPTWGDSRVLLADIPAVRAVLDVTEKRSTR